MVVRAKKRSNICSASAHWLLRVMMMSHHVVWKKKKKDPKYRVECYMILIPAVE